MKLVIIKETISHLLKTPSSRHWLPIELPKKGIVGGFAPVARVHTQSSLASLPTWCCGRLQISSLLGVEPTLWVLEDYWNPGSVHWRAGLPRIVSE